LQRRLEIMVVEEERRRIARDLHDGLGAELTLLAWAASSSTGAGASDQRLQELSQRARASLHELRRVVSGLKAPDMRVAELGALLEDSCRELVEPVSRFRLEVAGNGTLRGNVCLQVSLVVREAVRNAVTHAAPSSVSVSLDARSELVISVENDGASLPPEAAEKSRGGLSHLRERADLLGGTLFVEPLSAGTRVSLRVPGNAAFVAP
jgi:signal transduction histidine kinase